MAEKQKSWFFRDEFARACPKPGLGAGTRFEFIFHQPLTMRIVKSIVE